LFPNINILGNVERPEYFGAFDVYLRGVGPFTDERGRFFLFRKIEAKRFPSNREIGDKLITLSMLYGDSNNMSTAQNQFIKSYPEVFSKLFKGSHEYPTSLSEEAEKAKENWEGRNKKIVIIRLNNLA